MQIAVTIAEECPGCDTSTDTVVWKTQAFIDSHTSNCQINEAEQYGDTDP